MNDIAYREEGFMEGSDIRKQWHAPFCAAVRLELREDQEDLEFIEEYNLS